MILSSETTFCFNDFSCIHMIYQRQVICLKCNWLVETCFKATFVHTVWSVGCRTTTKANESDWKMKHSSDIAKPDLNLGAREV